MSSIKKIVVGALVASLVTLGNLVSANDASAWNYYCTSIGVSKSHSVRYLTDGPTWGDRFDTGRSRWNNAGLGIAISKSASAGNTIEAVRSGLSNILGVYSKPGSNYSITINAAALEQNAPAGKYGAWSLSTTTHEFGHAFRLPDRDSDTNASLMNHRRDRAVVGSPTSFDKDYVNYCY